MTAWSSSLNLVEPLGLGDLIAGLDSLATAANATLDAAGTALDAAKVLLTGTQAPQAGAAAALVTQAQGLVNDLFGAGFFQLFAHPWQYGVGRGTGPWRELSFPRCVQVIAKSFDDLGDAARPQFSSLAPVELLVLIAGAPSPAIFAQVLAAFNALIDSKEFRLAQRRLAQALELEAQRFTRTQGSVLPDWRSVTVRDVLPVLHPVEDALRDTLALLAGYAAGADAAVDIAADLIATKRQQLGTLQSRLAAAAALFGAGLENAGVYALHVAGTGGNALLKSELTGAAGGPGPELSFCAGVAWVGIEGTLTPLADLLGLP